MKDQPQIPVGPELDRAVAGAIGQGGGNGGGVPMAYSTDSRLSEALVKWLRDAGQIETALFCRADGWMGMTTSRPPEQFTADPDFEAHGDSISEVLCRLVLGVAESAGTS